MTQPVLQAQDLARFFGSVQALQGLNLAVHPGEVYGLVGPDGAGKTTAIRILAGLMAPTKGSVAVGGKDPLRDRSAVRDLLGYMPQQYSLYGDLTVQENLDFFASMFCLDAKVYRERQDRLLAMTRLSRFRDRRADALSGGMYKKLALSTSLLHHPRVLLLDEPTNGVDPVSRREFWDLLAEFVTEGTAVLISTPYMDEASRCSRVGLIHHGRILQEGVPAALLQSFPHLAFRVIGGDRDAITTILSNHPCVLALSPAGARMRLVIKSGSQHQVQADLEPLGAHLEPCQPDFEDVFLTSMVGSP